MQEDSAGRLDLGFRDLGEQQLKNIARPVRAYASDMAGVRRAGPSAPSAPRLSIGKPRRLTPTFLRLFTFLYRHRGDVIENDRLYAELYGDMEQPMAANAVRENVRRLRKALAGSRYEIVNHPTLGHELIVTAQRRTRRAAEASEGPSSVDANASTRS